jgi:hypothetical protein
MFQKFILKQAIKAQLKDVPADQQEMILAMVEKNPDFFMNLAKEVEEKAKGGMDKAQAVVAVLESHRSELAELLGKK